MFATASEGGVWHGFSRSSTTGYTRLYDSLRCGYPHLKRPARFGRGRKAGDVSDPPKNRGVMRPATDALGTCLCTGPHGVAHVLIYPCGKAQKQPPGAGFFQRVGAALGS